ncbi:MAG: hypothetical protein PUC50_05645, partial [Bacteroidales bacterium]|nr:hypothetical protein [Bacteroidales bacterium]
GMLTVIIRNQDYKEAQIPVQLFMSITHSFDKQPYITTKNPNPTRIINLKSNDALVLTGKDLECLFNTAYLTYKGPNLKDGSNILKIYARDIRTGKVVSNTASLSLRSVTIQPPRLVSPDNRLVYETDNQFMEFRWKGDNGGTHRAASHNYVYCLEIWRQMSDNPYVDTIRTPEIITADNLKTENYQLALPMCPMEIGGRYCWRVRAHDPSGRATFSQNGWSEVRSFTYKHLPVPVTGLTHTIKQTTRRATVTWDAAEGHTKYYIEYYNPQTQKTISNTTAEPRYELAAAPDSEYKILFRVKAQCWGDDSRTSDWTPWDTIKYSARQRVESEYECGHKFPHVDITNFDLKTDFEEGDIVSEANGSSNYEIINYTADPDGTLRGQFYLVMDAWGGAKIACEFWDTKVNTDNVVITTRYRSIDLPGYVANPDEIQRYVKSLWLDANSVASSSKIRDTIVIKEKFDYLYTAADGTLYAVVVNSDGTITETEVHTNKNTSQCLITDGQGDSLVISQKGQPMGIKEYRATGGNKALLKEYHRKSDSLAQWQINFKSAEARQTYAFDHIGSGNHGIFDTDQYYPKSGNYDFRYKSVESGKTDRVIVDFGSYSEKDSVIFKDKYGVKLKVVDGNILAFTGVSTADTNFIYAYRGDKKIGKLFLNTYQKKTYKVVLVSVNGATLPNTSTLEEFLNKVYNQCAVKFEISTDEFSLPALSSFSHGGSGILTVYNDDQKRVLQAYDKEMKDGVYYLFFIDNVTDKKDGNGTSVSGYMPRGYNCGFIYDGGSERTIAHELGHGIAGLEHVFENSNASGKTANLMDYSFAKDAEELWHFQWDQIQDPSRVWMKWNKAESEGENRLDNQFYFQEKCKKIYFIFSPYFSKKFELLLKTDDESILTKLNQWADPQKYLDATQSKNVKNGIYKSIKLDSKEYQTKIDYFKSQYNEKTPVVKIVDNPEGTDTKCIAVYCLIGKATNITTLTDFDKSDIYIQEPYFLSRYEVDVINNTLYQNTTEREINETIFEYAKDKSKKNGVFHIDLSVSKEAGLVYLNIGSNKLCGIGMDRNGCVALFGNFSFFANVAGSLGLDLNINSYKDFSIIKAEEMQSVAYGGSAGISLSFNYDYGYNDIRQLFGKSYYWSVEAAFLRKLDVCVNFNDNNEWIGVGIGYGIGGGLSVSGIATHTNGYIFTQEEFLDFFNWLSTASIDLETKTFKYKSTEIKMIEDKNYWITENALKLLESQQ